MHTCREIEKLLDTYTDGELDEPRRLMVEAHLQGCALCSRLAHSKGEEARLIRSGDPVPALSAGFTAQVMSNLTRSDSQAREGFFSLSNLFARPWLVPALAGLILLATVSWAVSSRLLPASPRQVAFLDSTAGRTVQMPKTPASFGNNNPGHQALELGLPPGVAWEDAQGSDSKKTLNISEGSANINGPAAGSAVAYGPESSRAIVPSPQKNGATDNSSVAPKTMAPQTSAAPQAKGLEQQGYAEFEPGYLPAGYSLETSSPQQSVPGNGSTSTPLSGQDSMLFTYHNAQTGGWITLKIQPLNNPAQQPVTPSVNPGGSPAAGAMASANTTGNQPTGADQITWQAQKNGVSFLLTVTGSLPEEELKMVADKVH